MSCKSSSRMSLQNSALEDSDIKAMNAARLVASFVCGIGFEMAKLSDLPVLIKSENWAAAERLLRQAAKAKTAPAEIYYNLAKVLEKTGKRSQSITWLNRAVARRPDYAIAWFELGRALLAHGDIEASLNAYQRACALDPKDSDARRMVARLALRLGLWDQVKAALQDDQDPEARCARYRVEAETGTASKRARDALLTDPSMRPEALRTLTRVSKGSISLRLL